jgi:hypothetical protein
MDRSTYPPVSRRTDPATSHIAEADLNRSGRRASQKDRILWRLMSGPATNAELAAISLKYTGRISDLRADGWRIEPTLQPDGRTIYRLRGRVEPPPPQGMLF